MIYYLLDNEILIMIKITSVLIIGSQILAAAVGAVCSKYISANILILLRIYGFWIYVKQLMKKYCIFRQ